VSASADGLFSSLAAIFEVSMQAATIRLDSEGLICGADCKHARSAHDQESTMYPQLVAEADLCQSFSQGAHRPGSRRNDDGQFISSALHVHTDPAGDGSDRGRIVGLGPRGGQSAG
jgi:hypothetical protein